MCGTFVKMQKTIEKQKLRFLASVNHGNFALEITKLIQTYTINVYETPCILCSIAGSCYPLTK